MRQKLPAPPLDARFPWWEGRQEELIALARESGPTLVLCEEILNEICFDLLSLGAVDELLHPVGLVPHPRVLEAAGRLGCGFLCRSPDEIEAVHKAQCGRPVGRLLSTAAPGIPLETVTVAREIDSLGHDQERLRDREVLLTVEDPGTLSADLEPMVATLRREGIRVQGLYLPAEHVAWLETLGGRRPGGWLSTLALGSGAGLSFAPGSARLDPERTGERLQTIRRTLGDPQLWISPGALFYSEMAALLIPVERPAHRITPTDMSLPEAWVAPVAEALAGRGARPGRLTATVPGPNAPGDVLILWPFEIVGGPTRYLNARRICQVRL